MSQRLLNSTETASFLLRHFDAAAKVGAHTQLVRSGLWSQRANDISLAAAEWYPIPPWGLTVKDDAFGYVVIFPNVRGDLFFNANVPESVALEPAKPVYYEPSGNSLAQMFDDLKAGIGGIALIALIALLGWKILEKRYV